MPRKPRIAVAPTEKMPEDVRTRTPNDYLESLRLAGGEVLVLDLAVHDPVSVLADVDGLMLLGGHDIDPAIYGEPAHTTFEPAAPGRDAFELALARTAVDQAIPLLAICRGLQVLNVALGGTLVQDIPSQVTAARSDWPIDHAVRVPKDRLAHPVTLRRRSRLESALGPAAIDGYCDVNSRHHQSVRDVGRGLTYTATAGDGVIEAVEHEDLPFCLGVQWHPENFWHTGRFQALFDTFVRATRSA
jgi:putative glutamine amidotransferase